MINDELRPIVTEFVAEMINDPHCESILLDVGEDAIVGSDLPIIYLGVTGKRYGCTLTIVCGEYSVIVRDRSANETITTIEKGKGAWGLQELLTEIKTRLWEDK